MKNSTFGNEFPHTTESTRARRRGTARTFKNQSELNAGYRAQREGLGGRRDPFAETEPTNPEEVFLPEGVTWNAVREERYPSREKILEIGEPIPEASEARRLASENDYSLTDEKTGEKTSLVEIYDAHKAALEKVRTSDYTNEIKTAHKRLDAILIFIAKKIESDALEKIAKLQEKRTIAELTGSNVAAEKIQIQIKELEDELQKHLAEVQSEITQNSQEYLAILERQRDDRSERLQRLHFSRAAFISNKDAAGIQKLAEKISALTAERSDLDREIRALKTTIPTEQSEEISSSDLSA